MDLKSNALYSNAIAFKRNDNISLCLSFTGEFKIVEPFPAPIYPIEHSSAKVTCVAYDAAGEKIPKNIMFKRVDQFNNYINLTEDGNIYFTGRTEGRMIGRQVKLNAMDYERTIQVILPGKVHPGISWVSFPFF